MTDLRDRVTDFEVFVAGKKAQRQMLLGEIETLKDKVSGLQIKETEKAAVLFKNLADLQKERTARELSSLGTSALRYSLGPQYTMHIEMKGTAKNPEAYLWITKGSGEKEDPIEDNGGGLVDIVGVSMRFMFADAMDNDGPIIFDEPFKMVSSEFVPMLSEFVSKISQDFGRQIIAVSHNEYLSSMSDSNIEVMAGEDGKSIVRRGR